MEKLKVHLFFYSDIHIINARSRNLIEENFLNILEFMYKEFELSIDINLETTKDGGWIEIYQTFNSNPTPTLFVLSTVTYGPIIFRKFMDYLEKLASGEVSKNSSITNLNKIDEELKKEELKGKNPLKYFELYGDSNSIEDFENYIEEYILNNSNTIKFKKLSTNYFKSLLKNPEIEAISYQNYNSEDVPISDEIKIKRESFNNNIFDDDFIEPEYLNSQFIEIVAPVLNKSNAKWRGIYKGKSILFELHHKEFEFKILSKELSFTNGSTLNCELTIEKKVDSKGEIINSNFIVTHVNDLILN